MKQKLFFSTLLLCCFAFVNAQEEKEHEEDKEFAEKKHSIALVLGHTQITEGVEDGNKKWVSVPSWGIDYNYEINQKWAIGFHNDFIVESFIVEDNNGTEIERSSPFASTIVGMFKFCKRFSFVLGAGGEFSKEENLFLIRAGIEYGYRFHDNWELVANITNDLKIDAYNSWSIGIGIARKF